MSEHDRAWERIPWMVNGTLQGRPLSQLMEHLSECAECRAEVALQARVRAAVAASPSVEMAPQASFNKLLARIDAETQFRQSSPQSTPRAHRGWLVAMAAQWLLMAGITVWLVQREPAPYRTVTSPATVAAGEIKLVFDAQMTLAEVGQVLASSGLNALSGPSPAGVFVLTRDPQHRQADLDAIVMRLRQHPDVRFAERSDVVE